jgi:hypothetical protein
MFFVDRILMSNASVTFSRSNTLNFRAWRRCLPAEVLRNPEVVTAYLGNVKSVVP